MTDEKELQAEMETITSAYIRSLHSIMARTQSDYASDCLTDMANVLADAGPGNEMWDEDIAEQKRRMFSWAATQQGLVRMPE